MKRACGKINRYNQTIFAWISLRKCMEIAKWTLTSHANKDRWYKSAFIKLTEPVNLSAGNSNENFSVRFWFSLSSHAYKTAKSCSSISAKEIQRGRSAVNLLKQQINYGRKNNYQFGFFLIWSCFTCIFPWILSIDWILTNNILTYYAVKITNRIVAIQKLTKANQFATVGKNESSFIVDLPISLQFNKSCHVSCVVLKFSRVS